MALLSACASQATPTSTPRPPTPTPVPPTSTPTRVPPTPTSIPPTPTPLSPGVTPPPATPTPTPLPTATPTPRPPNVGAAPVDTISDAEWAQIVEAAKKEGKLTCYCFDLVRDSWEGDLATRFFKETYGIDLEIIGLPPSLMVERIKSEARAGQYIADVVAIGAPEQTGTLEPGGFLQRIDNLPALIDVKDPNAWLFDPILTPYTLLRTDAIDYPAGHYTVNTNIVSSEKYPQKPQDLLDPWWKENKICEWEPTAYAVVDFKFWNNFREYNYADWYVDYFYDLYNTGNRFFFTFAGQPAGLNRGDCAISVSFGAASASGIKQAAVLNKVTWIKVGTFADLKPAPIVGSDAISVMGKAPHPNAALLFVNWRYSKGGQEAVAGEKGGLASMARLDVPSLVEKKYWPENPVTTFWVADTQWYKFEQYSYASKVIFKLAKEGMTREAWHKWVENASMNFWGQYPPPPANFFTVER
ncbi:MAG: ABC transporter substrate-binding protein [Chloroflexi bacterium]|nr:ABC transporter substrate-binding protein [Chloroflexota bacterium]